VIRKRKKGGAKLAKQKDDYLKVRENRRQTAKGKRERLGGVRGKASGSKEGDSPQVKSCRRACRTRCLKAR